MTADPYTLEKILCDDAGIVSGSYLRALNWLRAYDGHPAVNEPFTCTGHAHLAGEHIRCLSSAHQQAWQPTTVSASTWVEL